MEYEAGDIVTVKSLGGWIAAEVVKVGDFGIWVTADRWEGRPIYYPYHYEVLTRMEASQCGN